MDRPVMIDAEEVAKRLGMSKNYGYKVIRELNAEQEKKGRPVIRGRIRSDVFENAHFGGAQDADLLQ